MTKPSRQRRWQIARQKQGLCTICGDEPLVTKAMGEKCRRRFNVKNREARRAKLGSKRRNTNCPSYSYGESKNQCS